MKKMMSEAKVMRMKQHIIESEMAKGKSRKEAERIAFATASEHGFRRSNAKRRSVAPIPTSLRSR